VGDRVTTWYDRPWHESEPADGRLVVIGLKGLDRAGIGGALAALAG
jgi:cobalamin biosynthesis protein CobW